MPGGVFTMTEEWYWNGIYEFEEMGIDGKFDWDCIDCGTVLINSKEEYLAYKPAEGHKKGELKINDEAINHLRVISNSEFR
jgi:hypothetical protein